MHFVCFAMFVLKFASEMSIQSGRIKQIKWWERHTFISDSESQPQLIYDLIALNHQIFLFSFKNCENKCCFTSISIAYTFLLDCNCTTLPSFANNLNEVSICGIKNHMRKTWLIQANVYFIETNFCFAFFPYVYKVSIQFFSTRK